MPQIKEKIARHIETTFRALVKKHEELPDTRCTTVMKGLTELPEEQIRREIDRVVSDPKVWHIRTTIPFNLHATDIPVFSDFLASILATMLDTSRLERQTVPCSVELVIYPNSMGEFNIIWAHAQSQS